VANRPGKSLASIHTKAGRMSDMCLNWNVFRRNPNLKQIETYNIFEHNGFLVDCMNYAIEYKDNTDQFIEEVRKSLLYYFWSKCEWELVLSAWPDSNAVEKTKIDVYDQVMMNWEQFSTYLIENMDLLQSKNTDDLRVIVI